MLAAANVKPVDLDEQKRIADGVMANLGKWGPGEWPSRPAVLTLDDGQIVTAYHDRELGKKQSKEVKDQLGFFGTWRGAILRIEAEGSGKLQVLLRVANYLEFADRYEDLEQLVQFVRDWYHLPLPRADIPQNPRWQAKICDRYCQNRNLLPTWLREMTRPPPGYETAGGKEDAKEKKPEPPQRKLSFVGEDE